MNLEKLKPSTATAIIICTSNVFSVGLSFYLLKREIYDSLEVFKLLGLCIAISTPIVALTTFGYLAFKLNDENFKKMNDDSQEISGWAGGGIISLVVFHFFLMIAYITKMELRDFYMILSGVVSGYFITGLFKPPKKAKTKSRIDPNQ